MVNDLFPYILNFILKVVARKSFLCYKNPKSLVL
jgi:hypothetical protein